MSNTIRLKIYLMINDKIITQTLDEFLTSLGYQVFTLQTIAGLLEIFKHDSEGKALVISEKNIFWGQEQAIIRKIHQQYPDILFVVITENRAVFSIAEAISYGIYGYLHKPISLVELELLLVRLKEKQKI